MRIVAVCPSVERLDLVRQLYASYRETWAARPTTDESDVGPPSLVVVAMGQDGTAGWCRNQAEQGAPLHVVQPPEILPYSKAVNLGAKAALELCPDAEFLLLLNNDLALQPGFWDALAEMVSFGYEIVGAKLLYPPDYVAPPIAPPVPDGEQRIQHFGKVFSLDVKPFHVLRYLSETHPQAQQPRPFPNVTFACVAIKRAVWEGVGGLDEQYTNGYEDDDFCCAAREGGAQIGVHPGVLAWHWEGQTTGQDLANKNAMGELFHKKWVETGRIQWVTGVFAVWGQ